MAAKAKLSEQRITPLKDGTYSYRIQLGRERVTVIRTTKGALKQEVGRLIEEYNDRKRGVVVGKNPPRDYDEACARMLAVFRGRPSSKTSLESSLTASRKRWKNKPLTFVTRYEGERWLHDMATLPSDRTKKPLAHTSQRAYLKAANRVLNYSVAHDWLDKNRLAGLEVIITDTAPDPWESWDDIFRIADAFLEIGWPVGRRITLFAAGLGLRPQEMLAARDCDLLPFPGQFYVRRTWDDTLRMEVEETKTRGSNAPVPLTEIAREALEGRPPGLPVSDWRYSPLLFSHENGRIISTDYFLDKWHEAVKKTGLRYRPPGSLRETFGTLTLIRLGVDHIKTVATLMRHDSYRTTELYYIGLIEQLRRDAGATAAAAGEPSYAAYAAKQRAADSG